MRYRYLTLKSNSNSISMDIYRNISNPIRQTHAYLSDHRSPIVFVDKL